VHICGRIGEDFFGEVNVVVGEVPDIAAVYAGEVDG